MQWSDSGPGRFGVEFNAQARVDGFNHFPSTPNGTEICQEMDQLFAYLKSLLNDNMDKIEKGRWEVEDPSAQISMEEIASAIFGLDVTMKNGKVVELVDAFAVALSRERIMAAIHKCGYAPATRNSLNSEISVTKWYLMRIAALLQKRTRCGSCSLHSSKIITTRLRFF